MATEKTKNLEWDKPVFPSNNLDTELSTLFDQIDTDVSKFGLTVSDSTTKIVDVPDGLNFGDDLVVFDDGDGSVTINSTAISPNEKGAADGVAELDSSAKIPTAQLPSIAVTETDVVADQTERLALDAETGDIAVQQDENQSYILKGSDPSLDSEWAILETPTADVASVFGRTGQITASSGDYTHSQIANVSSNDHHNRYTDTEAESAAPIQSVNGKTGNVTINGFSGSHLDLTDIQSDAHHSRYTDSEAATAAPIQSVNGKTGNVTIDTSSGSHTDLTDVTANDHHEPFEPVDYTPETDTHNRYTDSEAVSAIETTPLSSNLDLGDNNLNRVSSIDSTNDSDAYIRTKGGGSDLWRFYDEANGQNIAEFREGGDVAIPNGGVVMGNFKVEQNSSTNSLDFNYTG
jgi:hypothetical protein